MTAKTKQVKQDWRKLEPGDEVIVIDDHAHETTDYPGCSGTIPTDLLGGHPEVPRDLLDGDRSSDRVEVGHESQEPDQPLARPLSHRDAPPREPRQPAARR